MLPFAATVAINKKSTSSKYHPRVRQEKIFHTAFLHAILIDCVFVTGTILSGLLVLCCGKPRVERKEDRVAMTVCVNFAVG